MFCSFLSSITAFHMHILNHNNYFVPHTISIWNTLPYEVTSSSSCAVFNTHLHDNNYIFFPVSFNYCIITFNFLGSTYISQCYCINFYREKILMHVRSIYATKIWTTQNLTSEIFCQRKYPNLNCLHLISI